MTATARRSPLLPPTGGDPKQVADAVYVLEKLPALPDGTPASASADGYHGQICQDENYVYFYHKDDGWARIARAW